VSHRASILERIAWTEGFTRANDKLVLQQIARWADFESGRNAWPGMEDLVQACAPLPQRTVERSLARLVAEQWVFAERHHRRRTRFHINVARLATHPFKAKAGGGRAAQADFLSATVADRTEEFLSAMVAGLSAKSNGLVRHCGGRTRDQVPVISTQEHPRAESSAPAASAAAAEANAAMKGGEGESGMAAQQGATVAERAGDVSAGGGDRAGGHPGASGGVDAGSGRPGEVAASRVGVPPGQLDHPSGAGGADGSGAHGEPRQQSFGPLALGADERLASMKRGVEQLREALARARRQA
jgi:hypothetical protein